MQIDPLREEDASAVCELLGGADNDFFDGLPADASALAAIFAAAEQDRYWAIRIDGRLCGIFMLRGLDEGYAAPAFGVLIESKMRGRGLGRLALQFAEAWCRVTARPEIMLTVSERNTRAIALYENAGWKATGERSEKGNLVFRKALAR